MNIENIKEFLVLISPAIASIGATLITLLKIIKDTKKERSTMKVDRQAQNTSNQAVMQRIDNLTYEVRRLNKKISKIRGEANEEKN